jgi:hypothetical protein
MVTQLPTGDRDQFPRSLGLPQNDWIGISWRNKKPRDRSPWASGSVEIDAVLLQALGLALARRAVRGALHRSGDFAATEERRLNRLGPLAILIGRERVLPFFVGHFAGRLVQHDRTGLVDDRGKGKLLGLERIGHLLAVFSAHVDVATFVSVE